MSNDHRRNSVVPKLTKAWNIHDPGELAALLDGLADQAAAAFLVRGAGLLRLEDDFMEAIDRFEAPAGFQSVGPNYALTEFLEFVRSAKYKEDTQLANIVYEIVSHRTTTAYLFGLAVGRRLGPQPLATRKAAKP